LLHGVSGVLPSSSAWYLVAIRHWQARVSLAIVIGFCEEGRAFGFAVPALAAVAILNYKICCLGCSRIYLRRSLFDELILFLAVG
jgi:hypothetical protein